MSYGYRIMSYGYRIYNVLKKQVKKDYLSVM